jgi:hypothetical protein
LNNLGQVAGRDTLGKPMLFSPGRGRMDLNAFSNAAALGWRLYRASSVNDAGQIVGVGTQNGVWTNFRLDPN